MSTASTSAVSPDQVDVLLGELKKQFEEKIADHEKLVTALIVCFLLISSESINLNL